MRHKGQSGVDPLSVGACRGKISPLATALALLGFPLPEALPVTCLGSHPAAAIKAATRTGHGAPGDLGSMTLLSCTSGGAPVLGSRPCTPEFQRA